MMRKTPRPKPTPLTWPLMRISATGSVDLPAIAPEIMVIRGGFNVYPREIEEVLMTHPAIQMAAVVGVPHDVHGEEIKAFVVARQGIPAEGEEIMAWCRERMAAYKYPRIVQLVESLPMTATGKILKRELRN